MTEISDFQRGNLLTLADYLDQLPEDYGKFDMERFHSRRTGPTTDIPCGAVACAIGHGPAAGIAPVHDDKGWFTYSRRVFTGLNRCLWNWCFSACWAHTDNTPQGAAKRIRWALNHGIPNNYVAQTNGAAPLCYKENT